MTVCRSRNCGQAILWTITETGKRMPVNAEPAEDGNVRVVRIAHLDRERLEHLPDTPASRVLTGLELERAREAGEELYLAHFATCPAGSKFRGHARRR